MAHETARISYYVGKNFTEDFESKNAKTLSYPSPLNSKPPFGSSLEADIATAISKQEQKLNFYQNEKKKQENVQTISLTAFLESSELAAGSVHKLWGMIRLDASYNNSSVITNIDFIVVIDHSSSMKMNSKLAFVQATIEYLVTQLSSAHQFCLIQFNQDVDVVTNGLVSMTPENKKTVLSLLRGIKPEGSTNISDAIFTAIGILNQRKQEEQSRLSSVMLFTDGLANAGLRGSKFLKAIKELEIPSGLTINTFGYGLDHDSKMLQNISFCSQGGVYYYIETVESIAATFGECLAGMVSTVAHNITVRMNAHDGCRIVNYYTRYPIAEHQSVKCYSISLGSMYSQESKTILFKLSLRKMDPTVQNLVDISVSFVNTLSGVEQVIESRTSVTRPSQAQYTPIPVQLDKHINRYTAAAAIEEAVSKANIEDFTGAREQLQIVIEAVKNSVSAHDLSEKQYCDDLIQDLKECANGMMDKNRFTAGIHYAHAFSTMYYMERSTGTANLVGFGPSHTDSKRRHNGYGYMTFAQEEEATKAKKEASHYIAGYLENVFLQQ